jgi:uncharacterized protein (TIGR02646 family)
MIHVDRTRVPKPASLDGLTSKGWLEREEAVAFYDDPLNAGKDFSSEKFRAYKDEEVKKALNELFQGKCAYCESPYASTAPVDVEHFRPKAGILVDGKLTKPGYYWLAADWDNLLPSCIDCNRSRTQEFDDKDPQKSGKANQFPVADENRRAQKPGKENEEEYLLLDPCRDDPQAHLEFLAEGVIRARLAAPETLSRKGTTSIEVYGLQRKGLVDARRDLLVFLYDHVDTFIFIREKVANNPQRVATERVKLDRYAKPDQPYSAMARQVLDLVDCLLSQIDRVRLIISTEPVDWDSYREELKKLLIYLKPEQPFADLTKLIVDQYEDLISG